MMSSGSTAASPNMNSHQYHAAYSSSPGSVSQSRTPATRLDDAINQLRSLKQQQQLQQQQQHGAAKPPTGVYQTQVSSPTRGPVMFPGGITSVNQAPSPHRTGSPTGARYPAGNNSMSYARAAPSPSNGSMKSPPPTARKPTIPPQLRRTPSNPNSPGAAHMMGKPSPSDSTSSTTSSYGGDNMHVTRQRALSSSVTLDSHGRCTCCPFGYHVDIDFVNFSQDARSPTTPTFNKPVRKPRLSFDSGSSQHSNSGAPTNYSGLFIDDIDHTQPVTVEVQHTQYQSAPPQQQQVPHQVPVQQVPHQVPVQQVPFHQQRAVRSHTASTGSEYNNRELTSPVTTVTTTEETYRSRQPNGLMKSDSSETIDSMMNYSNQVKTTRRVVTSTQLAETMATHLPDNGGTELTISADSVEQIKKHMALSLQRMQELEDQVKLIPIMQERISRLKWDKKSLAEQLSSKSSVSSMRSIGVGDYDVDEEQTRIEKVIQTVVQEAPAKPKSERGVGNYDVTVEYLTEAEAYHTLAEKVQLIREKEIQTWRQEVESEMAARKAALRSVGVGDGDVFAEPETIKVKEKEIKTVYIEPDKPEQRNVGLQVKPTMRDVCIEYSQHEEKPSTRTVAINVDLNDILQETESHYSGEVERTESGEYQSAGALASGQKNAWQTQKHVIQRKFMEAMHRGTQHDLVAFITGLLRRSVRSVGTTVKPVTAEFGMKTSSSGLRGTDRAVGDDTVNVIVKPYVMTRDNFCTVKPVTRTQPTWTDLILTCDSATNTQEIYTGKLERAHRTSVSRTSESPTRSPSMGGDNSSSTVTTRTVRTSSSSGAGSVSGGGSVRKGSSSGSAPKDISREYVESLLTAGGGVGGGVSGSTGSSMSSQNVVTRSSSSRHGSTHSQSQNKPEHHREQKTEITEDGSVRETVHEVRSAPGMHEETTVIKHEGPGGSMSEMVQQDSSSQQTKITQRSTLDQESILGSNFQQHKADMMALLSGQKTQAMSPISVDTGVMSGGVSGGGSSSMSGGVSGGGSSSMSGGVSRGGSSSISAGGSYGMSGGGSSGMSGGGSSGMSGGGSSGMSGGSAHGMSGGSSFAMSGGSSGMSSGGMSGNSSSMTTRTYSSHMGSQSGTLSPKGVIIEREGAAQRKYEEDLRRRNMSPTLSGGVVMSSSGGGALSTGMTTSRHVTSGNDGRGDFSEVVEEKESGDGSRKEVIIEKTYTSSSSSGGGGRFEGGFPDFSNYFDRGAPPQGRSDRMMGYDSSSTYSTTASADMERNKTEIAGNPLKARYKIDDLSSPGGPRSGGESGGGSNSGYSSSTTTQVIRTSSGSEQIEGGGSLPRSIIKREKESSANRNITFAERAEVAEVVEDNQEQDGEGFSEEESEVSFEEGTYDGSQGEVSYQCEVNTTQSTMSKAKSQEEIDIDVELQAACSIVQQHIESGDTSANSKVSSALSVIQQDWFKVASGQQATYKEVDGYMACFEDFSTELLEHVINMSDGNGNTALHYAVSHCNFPIVRLVVDSGVADVNLQNKAGYTPIMLAALAEVNSEDDRDAIRLLLSKGNVNLAASQAGQTALMLAVSHGRHEMVQLLLEAGSDINIQDEDGSTALMCATEHGHVDIVKTLLNHHDIDIQLKDNDGSTALEIALENSQKEIGILLYAKDQSNKANTTTSIKKRTSRIPSSSGRSGGGGGGSKSSSSRVVTVTRRRY